MKLLGAHQNIVSLVGCCTLQEKKFLVIEYVPCGDLLQWLRRRRQSVRSFPKKYLNNLILPQAFGSNLFYGNSSFKESVAVLHDIVHAIIRCSCQSIKAHSLICNYRIFNG